MLSGIYAISDTTLTPNVTQALKTAIKGGITLFQLRDKTSTDATLAPICEILQRICQESGVTFVLNDRVELAKSLTIDALHIGKKDDIAPYSLRELEQVRKDYHGILGVSCYGDLNLAKNALQAGADYIAFGACFASRTKPNAKTIDLNIFHQAKEFGIPLCAIGGINATNIHCLKEADMVACVRSIWEGDIIQNIKELKEKWGKECN